MKIAEFKERGQWFAWFGIGRFIAIAMLGAFAWELFAYFLGYEFNPTRACAAGLVYAAVWEILIILTKCRTLPKLLLLGIVAPYVAIVCSIFGIWLIFVALQYWWIFAIAGMATSGVTYFLRCNVPTACDRMQV